jgi:hypothetical protein
LLYLPTELGVRGQRDERHLAQAANLGAVLVTQNRQDFAPLFHRWEAEEREHPGILLVVRLTPLPRKIAYLERAARLLTPKAARNQLMELELFDTEEQAEAYVAALTPLPD